MTPATESATEIGQIIQLAVAPVFLLAGVGAFLNVCAARLARIVDRGRALEPIILEAKGERHDRLVTELRTVDRRMRLVSTAITLTVTSAVLICAVVVLLFGASLIRLQAGTAIALLFIGSMVTLAASLCVFLVETRVAARAIRVRKTLLTHEAEEPDTGD